MLSSFALRKLSQAASLALPGLLTLYLCVSGGGFFAGQPAVVAALLAILLALRATLVEEPFAGLSVPLAVAGAALGAFAGWTLLSSIWSDAPARAIVEYDRALMFWLALAFFGSIPQRPGSLEWGVRGLWLAITTVGIAALLTRVLPELWPISANIENERLSYPLTYWNALGIVAGLGLVLGMHLASSEREPVFVRVLGAVSCPLLTATLVLTFSRGAIIATAGGLVLYLVLARPWGALGGLVAVVPASAVAAVGAYGADLLAQKDPTTTEAISQGEGLALTLAGCAAVAGLLRVLLVPLDRRLSRIQVPARRRRGAAAGVAVAVGAGLLLAGTAFGGAAYADRQYDRFVNGSQLSQSGEPRSRLTDVGNNGRLDHWEVALDAFERDRWTGVGAGVYALEWARERERRFKVEDAHSLYVEVLGELGVVGLVLLAIALAGILYGFVAARRAGRRHVHAVLLACALAWMAHAGIDWDWEMPATGLWLFALGGMCLARPAPDSRRHPRRLTRVVVGLGCLALALIPVALAVSQTRLNDSVRQLKAGDCEAAIDSALASNSALSVRPEPYQVLSLCDARLGEHQLAIAAARRFVTLDSDNWEGYYTLALVRANAGLDPRRAARRALQLNPLGILSNDAIERFDTSDPKKWKRRARSARLPLQ